MAKDWNCVMIHWQYAYVFGCMIKMIANCYGKPLLFCSVFPPSLTTSSIYRTPPQVIPRKKKPDPWESPKVGGVSTSVSGNGGEKRPTKGPSRRAPPPPTSKKPGAARQLSNEEVSTL